MLNISNLCGLYIFQSILSKDYISNCRTVVANCRDNSHCKIRVVSALHATFVSKIKVVQCKPVFTKCYKINKVITKAN